MSARQVTCRVPSRCVLRTERTNHRVNRVVVMEKTDCKLPYRNLAGVGSAFGTPLKICSGRIRGVCPPGICDCPNAICEKPNDKAKRLLTLGLKLGVVLIIIYKTWELGIWSDHEETAKLTYDYRNWAEDFYPTKNKISRTDEEIYDMRRIKYNFKNVWNNIQLYSNSMFQEIPAKLDELGTTILPRHSTMVDPKAKKTEHAS